jgi:hypothetical protein
LTHVRVYVDSEGETHFEDVELPQQERTTATGVRINRAQSAPIGGALGFVTVNPPDPFVGGEWDHWHPVPYPEFFVWLEGEVEVQVSDGEVRRFGPGDMMLCEDTSGKCHRTRRLTDGVRAVSIPLAPIASA